MEEFNVDQDYYERVYDAFCKNMLDNAYYYRDTKIERFSEDDIIVTLEDEQLSQEYIKNGIEYCAYYIAEKILERNFVKGPLSLEMIENILRRYNNYYIDNGSIIEPEKITIFIKALIDILNKKYQNRILEDENFSKNACISVLGFNHFPITIGKKFESNYPGKSWEIESGYFLDSIDNDYGKTIGEALTMVGLEGMFTKAANKMSFYVKNKRFGYVSMNSGHWIPKFDVTSKEKLEEYKLSVIAKITKDLSSELKENIISYLLYNGEQEMLNQQTVHKR